MTYISFVTDTNLLSNPKKNKLGKLIGDTIKSYKLTPFELKMVKEIREDSELYKSIVQIHIDSQASEFSLSSVIKAYKKVKS
jgi:hypothetical protein